MPEAPGLPQLRAAINGGQHRRDRADAAATDDVNFDAGFLDGAQCAGMVRAVGARPCEQERGAAFWRVGVAGLGHSLRC